MRLLDLYSGAGVGGVGYADVGFDVVGVDIKPQPSHPFEFHQGDAIEWLKSDAPEEFDVLHASPPCQAFTRASHLRDAQGGTPSSGDLLTPTLEILRERWSHKIFVVENVPGAKSLMPGAAVECGSAYSLGVRRHRLFLSNVPLVSSGCRHKWQGRPWGVYHRPSDSIPKGGRTARDLEHGKEVMGVTQECKWDELKEGLPPAFTAHVGYQLRRALDERE